MRFPVIKVRDKLTGREHIVGTDSHDTLYIDKETGGIHYYNLQNGEGTLGDYEFVGVETEYDPDPQIEFATVDQTEVQRLREALSHIHVIAQSELDELQYESQRKTWEEILLTAEEVLSTTTEPTKSDQDKTCVMCGTREGKYLSTANRWFCEPFTDALPPVTELAGS